MIAERFKFHHRNQREGETVVQYMAALRRLSEYCDFKDYLDQALHNRLVCGLRSEAIQRRLLSEKDLTLESAYDIAHSLETASQHASELQASVKTGAPSAAGVLRVVPGKPQEDGTSQSCHRCGKTNHPPNQCYYKHQKCRYCQKKGHIAKMCRSRLAPHGTSSPGALPMSNTSQRSHQSKQAGGSLNRVGYLVTEQGDVTEPEVPLVQPSCEALFAVTVKRDDPIILKPKVNSVELEMELHTGATVSLASEKTWKEILQECPLDECRTLLRTYTGERLPVLGQMNVQVRYEDQEAHLPLLIIPGDGPALWGRSWLTSIRLNWGAIKYVSRGLSRSWRNTLIFSEKNWEL